MKADKIKIGDILRHRTSINYSYYQVEKILKPKQEENTNSFIVVKCLHSVDRSFNTYLTKYIRPCDLVKE